MKDQIANLDSNLDLNEVKQNAKEHSRRARRNKNLSKTPDRLWTVLNVNKGGKQKFLNIEAISEENSTTSESDSPQTTPSITARPNFTLQLPKV